jgi:hypothetical protein
MKSYDQFKTDSKKKKEKLKNKKVGNVEVMPIFSDGQGKGMTTRATNEEVLDAKDFASTKHKGLPEKKVKKESFESGVLKARRYHRVGKLMSFKDFMKIMGEIMGEWEK